VPAVLESFGDVGELGLSELDIEGGEGVEDVEVDPWLREVKVCNFGTSGVEVGFEVLFMGYPQENRELIKVHGLEGLEELIELLLGIRHLFICYKQIKVNSQ
jgi:hypothetical protein